MREGKGAEATRDPGAAPALKRLVQQRRIARL